MPLSSDGNWLTILILERIFLSFAATLGLEHRWYGVRQSDWEAMMETVLFTDYGIVVFAITTSAIALMLSVLGLATTRRTRSDIEHQLRGCREGSVEAH